ncbi:formamidopyrimidine-DNA glycosylase [Luteimicrobium album]|uniref:Formamidopyrimidine-DNA glycosylase n=1 Tax=Luteimicrobium album TaxID=1054550 RepID=A0ABQ6I5H3_9MICO|nr:bifunctional DNA-formamidopyrimidine glycosylase/DNA-(apurinic or apyrimidinic site) lyase [Luteimicrobium album]GMA25383.1 formamidopyrimidine-DNA glycosylase [Luteimicrobium album]
MPELPEVETVRDGLARHVLGARVASVEVLRDYSVRHQDGGPEAFVAALTGARLDAAARRGKFLWLELANVAAGEDSAVPARALVAHLGMSGQLLVRSGDLSDRHRHLRVRLALEQSDGTEAALDFVDMRTFGRLVVAPLVATPDGAAGGLGTHRPLVPEPAAHIARDLLDPALDETALVDALRRRRTGVKRALLDQTLVSGVGNIYADEALWRARLHFARPTDTLRRAEATRLLEAAEQVMRESLAQGGTSFDALYVNVNGASGYYSRSLAVYGQEGRPCPRCGTPVRRDAFMNRSSFTCPRCQPRPRNGRW